MFKHCPMCGDRWRFGAEFLSDPYICFLGHELHPAPQIAGFFVFNHTPCDTRLAVPLSSFVEFSAQPVLAESCSARGIVEEYCLAAKKRGLCPPQCPCAFVAKVSRLI